jgi:hypothetical protein
MGALRRFAAALAALAASALAAACASEADAPTSAAAGAHADPLACFGCHDADYRGAHGHAGVKPETCAVCHGQEHWHPVFLRHAWALTGAHAKTACFACHAAKPPVYAGTPKDCVACHRREFDAENAKEPSHARSVEDCARCHSTNAWDEWPGHAKGERTPPAAATPPAATPPPAMTTRPPAPARPPATKAPAAPARPATPAPTERPSVVSGASRR